MSSPFNQAEQNRVRVAREAFFQTTKRKHPTAEDYNPSSSTATSETVINMSSTKRFKFPGMTSTKPSESPSKEPLIVRFYDANIQVKDAHGRTQEDILAWPSGKLESCHNYIQMLFPVSEGSAFNWEAPIIDREVMDTFRSRHDLRDRLRLSLERMLDFYGFQVASQEEEDEKTKGQDESHDSSEGLIEVTAEGSTSIGTRDVTATKSEDTKVDPATEAENKTTEKDTSKHILATEASPVQPGYHIIRAPHWRTSFRNWAVRFDHNHLRITRILRCLRILGLQTECEAFFKALKDVFDDPAVNISERTMSYWTRAVTRPLYIAPDDERVEWLKKWEEEREQEDATKADKGES